MSIEARSVLKAFLIIQTIVLALVPYAWARDFFGIVDYLPSTFIEKPTAPFFFSIGDKLRFGNVIAEDGPILFAAKPSDKGIWAVCKPQRNEGRGRKRRELNTSCSQARRRYCCLARSTT